MKPVAALLFGLLIGVGIYFAIVAIAVHRHGNGIPDTVELRPQ